MDQPTVTWQEFRPPVTWKKPLPDRIERVLASIPKEAPESFRRQARQAAEYIVSLDEGKPDMNAQLFRAQLRETGFIDLVFIMHSSQLTPNAPDPVTCLPKWLQQGTNSSVNAAQKKEIAMHFSSYVEKHAIFVEHHQQGDYYLLKPKPDPRSFDTYKIYIENQNLYNAFVASDGAKEFLDGMVQSTLGITNIKLNEDDRLVIYFDGAITPEVVSELNTLAARHRVTFRGPAQDVTYFKPDASGQLTREIISNDAALGHRGIPYSFTRYEPSDFLQNYLELCLKHGKNPAIPYMSSFIYLKDDSSTITPDQLRAYQRQITEETGYNPVHIKNGTLRMQTARAY